MRKKVNYDINCIKEEYITEITQYSKHILPALDQKLKSKVQNNILGKALNNDKRYVSEDDLIFIINKLLKLRP